MRRRALLLLLVGLCACAWAAPAPRSGAEWTRRRDLERGLPRGVVVRALERADPPLRAWCVEVDLRRSRLAPRVLLPARADGAPALETVPAQAAAAGAPVAVNAGYFGGGRSLSLALDRGRTLSLPPEALTRDGARYAAARGALGVLPDGTLDVAWVHVVDGAPRALEDPPPNRPGAPVDPEALRGAGAPWPARTAVGAGPVLVADGAPRVTWTEEVFFGSGIGAPDARQPRTAVGYTRAGRLLLVVVEGRAAASRGATLPELAALLVERGAVEALNLDGGGSSALALGGARVSATPDGEGERPVATVLALLPRADEDDADTGAGADADDGG